MSVSISQDSSLSEVEGLQKEPQKLGLNKHQIIKQDSSIEQLEGTLSQGSLFQRKSLYDPTPTESMNKTPLGGGSLERRDRGSAPNNTGFKSKFTNQTATFTIYENPLGAIKPDDWKNIPICLVNAFKLIINTNEHNYQNIRTVEAKFENIKNNNSAQFSRLDREIKRRDEELRVDLVAAQKELNQKIDAGIGDLSNVMKVQLKGMNTQLLEFTKLVQDLEKKVVRVLKEIPFKAAQDKEHFEMLDEKIKLVDDTINERIDYLIEENFTIPDIQLDKSLKPKSFRDYITGNLTTVARSIKVLDARLDADFLVKSTFNDYIIEQAQHIVKVKEDIERLEKVNTQGVEMVDHLQENINRNVRPQLAKLQSEISGLHEWVTNKLQFERDIMNDEFEKEQLDLKKKFDLLTAEMKAQVSDHAEMLKQAFHQDLKIQLVTHKKNMIDAVETKCFDLDNDLDNLKALIEQTQVDLAPIPHHGIHSQEDMLSEDKTLISSGNHPDIVISAYGPPLSDQIQISFAQSPPSRRGDESQSQIISSESLLKPMASNRNSLKPSYDCLQAGGDRYTRYPRIALAKSIDRFTEFRSRLEAVEKQVSTLLDNAYHGARSTILNQPNQQMGYKAMKVFQSGAKKLLEQKIVANDSIEKTKKHIEKLEDNRKVELDDDKWNKLYTKPESSYVKYKDKKSALNKSQLYPQFRKNIALSSQAPLSPDNVSEEHLLSPKMIQNLEISETATSANFQGKTLQQINNMRVFQNTTITNDRNQLISQQLNPVSDNQTIGSSHILFDPPKNLAVESRRNLNNEFQTTRPTKRRLISQVYEKLMTNVKIMSELNTTQVIRDNHRNRISTATPINGIDKKFLLTIGDSNKEEKITLRKPYPRPKTSKMLDINYQPLNDLNRHTANNSTMK